MLARRLCPGLRPKAVGFASAPEVVIGGCGVAGASTAMHLAERGAKVTIVDPRPPFTASSQYSTECYRDFFLDAALVPFMSRSVDILEELAGEANEIGLTRRGYCFFTATDEGCEALPSGKGAYPAPFHYGILNWIRLDLLPSVFQLRARMGCTASTVVESAQTAVFQDEDGVTTPEVHFKERSHSFHSMDDRTNPATAVHSSAPVKFTHKHWVKQLESVMKEIEEQPKALRAAAFEAFAERASEYGGGPVRRHRDLSSYRKPADDFRDPELVGFDLIRGQESIAGIFPFVAKEVKGLLHARRCGWLDSQGLGQKMLSKARAAKASVVRGHIRGFDKSGSGDISAVHVALSDGTESRLPCDAVVNAAGAWMPNLSELLLGSGSPLPLVNEVHAKVILKDTKAVIPQSFAPFMVWRDKVALDWDDEVKQGLLEMDDTAEGGTVNASAWIGEQPGGQHLRPAGNGWVVMLWEHLHKHLPIAKDRDDPEMPIESFLDMYPELCLAGLQRMVPGLAHYEGQLGRDTVVDGGYYTNTPDGRPLIGPHGCRNFFLCGGMGTYGLMGSPAAGELAAMHVLQKQLPGYASACLWPRTSEKTEPLVDLLDDSS
eukprot:s2834_g2.t3